MSNQIDNFTGSAFIEPLSDNTEPEYVTVIALLTPSGVDGDCLAVTFPSNEHVVFTPLEVGLPENTYDPAVILQNIVMKDWKNDPDVPHMIRWFMLQQEEFISNIDSNMWVVEIDTESQPGKIMTAFRHKKLDQFSVVDDEDEQEIDLEYV